MLFFPPAGVLFRDKAGMDMGVFKRFWLALFAGVEGNELASKVFGVPLLENESEPYAVDDAAVEPRDLRPGNRDFAKPVLPRVFDLFPFPLLLPPCLRMHTSVSCNSLSFSRISTPQPREQFTILMGHECFSCVFFFPLMTNVPHPKLQYICAFLHSVWTCFATSSANIFLGHRGHCTSRFAQSFALWLASSFSGSLSPQPFPQLTGRNVQSCSSC